MAIGNEFFVVGNLTGEPELRFTSGGRAVTNFSIAYNKRWKDNRTGEMQEETHYFDVVAWGDLAENVAESVTKGDRVMIAGWVQQRTWEDKDTGAKRSKHEIVADEVGPALRWATATPVKVDRRTDGQGGGNRGGGSRGGGGGYGGQRSPAPQQSAHWDEEPF